jgi:hypothetical protein
MPRLGVRKYNRDKMEWEHNSSDEEDVKNNSALGDGDYDTDMSEENYTAHLKID